MTIQVCPLINLAQQARRQSTLLDANIKAYLGSREGKQRKLTDLLPGERMAMRDWLIGVIGGKLYTLISPDGKNVRYAIGQTPEKAAEYAWTFYGFASKHWTTQLTRSCGGTLDTAGLLASVPAHGGELAPIDDDYDDDDEEPQPAKVKGFMLQREAATPCDPQPHFGAAIAALRMKAHPPKAVECGPLWPQIITPMPNAWGR